ncbi:Dps family protein [Pedobacter zeae]|uniref:DNA starvation/stationary phase protection protein n=1 Tax=Pedobacter zeae TaxID=1737356 RepID=A0A7W6KAN3_9SPHI|nr:DNA starvation/stationary phase protection protein [Pedobacter zeae]MBB4108160.1 starvation-inducible DNA-binding protein [Pedobacter zeae]GGG94637.1 DNA starvation/stationary phase protection protein [Pedobacter zeae]
MEAKIGISAEHLAEVAHSLSKILADEFVLYTKTRKAHWNVEGPDFYNKHKFFEEQYNQLADIIDDVAERIRKLGHYAPATLKQYLELTHLTEDDRGKNDATSYIKTLLSDHESILIHLRENINNYATALKDAGTSDYITALMETHETMAWMLRAHLS